MQLSSLQASIAPEWRLWLLAPLLFVLAAATLEGVVLTLRAPRSYDWRAFAATLADVAGRRALEAFGLSLSVPFLLWVHEHRVATLALDNPISFVALFLGLEFFYYWHHRASHRVRWFWASHCVHHSPNELTLAAALRLGWTVQLSGAALFFAPLVWLGFSPLAVLAALAMNLLYQFWLHATWIPKLGLLELVFNTPSSHRVHHGSNPVYLDRNFGGVLIVFDRLFGTYSPERADEPPRYGLTVPLATHNPLRIELHEWFALGRDLAAARNWRERLAALFGPPRPSASLAKPSAVLASPPTARLGSPS
jgi:sterol desaturase/sphingolipid hydroxylase (fatty acid hydroxylase superfamily)